MADDYCGEDLDGRTLGGERDLVEFDPAKFEVSISIQGESRAEGGDLD